MKIPNHIKQKMHRLAKLAHTAGELSLELQNYFEANGLNMEDLSCGNGISFEEIESGNDITDEFCEWIESGRFSKGED